MSYVILSAGGSGRSRLVTLSTRKLLLGGAIAALFAAVAGGSAGYFFAMHGVAGEVATVGPVGDVASEAVAVGDEVAAEPFDAVAAVEKQLLIDRLGELSGRVVRLESEATLLARKVGVDVTAHDAVEGGASPTTSPAAADDAVTGGVPESSGSRGGPWIAPFGGDASAIALDEGHGAVDLLQEQIDQVESALARVSLVSNGKLLDDMAFPHLLPVREGRMTSGFGTRRDPFKRRWARHTGLDFAAPRGTPIHAAAGGRVIEASYHRDYGRMVEIDHGNQIVTRYAHATKLFVQVGDVVMPGEPIAAVGSTGRSTGPHLHYEVLRNGVQVNPKHFLPAS